MNRTGAVALLLMLVTTSAQAEELVGAVWYGNELRGHRTASGEMFDPDGLTAAHRSLPFGTCLVVGNPRTGQTVLVRVNDRALRNRSHTRSVFGSGEGYRDAFDRKGYDAALLAPIRTSPRPSVISI